MRRSILTGVCSLTCLALLTGSALAQRGHSSAGHSNGGQFSSGHAAPARSTQNFSRPAQNFSRPAQNFSRPAQNFSRPTQNFSRPTQNSVRPTQRPTLNTTQATQRPTQNSVQTSQRPTQNSVQTSQRPTQASAQNSKRPTTAGAPRPVSPAPGSLGLTDATNQTLVGIIGSGNVGPQTVAALNASLSGNLLTNQQAGFLQGALQKNTKLNATQKAAIASALQQDKAEKRQQAQANAKHDHHHHGQGGNSGGGDGGSSGGGDGGSSGEGDGTPVADGGSDGSAGAETGPGEVGSPASYGVRITHLYKGTAVQQGLLKGDVILSFNGMATPTFEALRDAVQQSGSQAEVVFINSENGQHESIVLYPESGAIGVSGESVPVE